MNNQPNEYNNIAVEKKKDVLDFISANFSVVTGSIDYDNTMDITVVKKNL